MESELSGVSEPLAPGFDADLYHRLTSTDSLESLAVLYDTTPETLLAMNTGLGTLTPEHIMVNAFIRVR